MNVRAEFSAFDRGIRHLRGGAHFRRMERVVLPWAGMKRSLVAAAVVLVACGSAEEAPTVGTSTQALRFAQLSDENGLPRDLLLAVAQTEGGLDMPAHRDVEEDVEIPAAGPLMLRRGQLDTLALGAKLAGTTEWELRKSTDLGLAAGAKVLATLGRQYGARPDDLGTWNEALQELSGYGDAAHREEYAHRVFALLARGGTFEGQDGQKVRIAPHDLPPSLTLQIDTKLSLQAEGPEYPGAEYFPIPAAKRADKLTVGRGGADVNYVVIHDTEGGWDGSVATLQNDPGKSVQYIIGQDGRVGQFMTEADTAYHAGNFYYNQRSVGIEHVGYSTKPYPTKQYDVSGKLVRHLADKYKVPKDRAHIIGHDQIPNGSRIASSSAPCATSPKACAANASYGGANHHTDPGVWEWARLMYLIGGKAKTNDVTTLWNCSSDSKYAFRDNGKGAVEVQECTACDVKPTGQDDVCTPKAVTPPVTEDGGTPGPGPGTGDAGTKGGTTSTVNATPNAEASGGCSTAPRGTSAPLGTAGLVVGGAALLGALRRRPRRA